MDKIRKNKRINALVLCLGELIIGILLLVVINRAFRMNDPVY